METKFHLAQVAAIFLSALLCAPAQGEALPGPHGEAKVCRGAAVHSLEPSALPFAPLHAPTVQECPRSRFANKFLVQCRTSHRSDLNPHSAFFAPQDSARVPAKYFHFIREE